MGRASHDQNNYPTLIAVSSVDGATPIELYANPTTHALLVDIDVESVTITGDALTALQNIDTDTTTIISHLDGVEGLLTDIEADTDTLAVVGGGTEATALRVTIATDSTGVLSVDDN